MTPDPTSYQFELPGSSRPSNASLREEWYPEIKTAAIQASSSRIYDPIEGIRAVVIHATAGSSSAGAASVIVNRKASFHWLVPDEDEDQHGEFVWATCHEARAAWHVRNAVSHPLVWGGKSKINHFSLGVEVVNAQISSDNFSVWQVEATAKIVRYFWAKYPNLRHVVSHARLDPTRRSDPGSQFPWEQFKDQVLNGVEEAVSPLVANALPPSLSGSSVASCCMPV
jgi:N-acetylmuramoyl-L-alanine amidase